MVKFYGIDVQNGLIAPVHPEKLGALTNKNLVSGIAPKTG
jgi:hypothetical protein